MRAWGAQLRISRAEVFRPPPPVGPNRATGNCSRMVYSTMCATWRDGKCTPDAHETPHRDRRRGGDSKVVIRIKLDTAID